jgi:hypothetical protein
MSISRLEVANSCLTLAPGHAPSAVHVHATCTRSSPMTLTHSLPKHDRLGERHLANERTRNVYERAHKRLYGRYP